MATEWDLGIVGGGCRQPIGNEDEIHRRGDQRHHRQALTDMTTRASTQGSTPFLLAGIVEINGGARLIANIALVENNARLGAQIAKEYATLPR